MRLKAEVHEANTRSHAAERRERQMHDHLRELESRLDVRAKEAGGWQAEWLADRRRLLSELHIVVSLPRAGPAAARRAVNVQRAGRRPAPASRHIAAVVRKAVDLEFCGEDGLAHHLGGTLGPLVVGKHDREAQPDRPLIVGVVAYSRAHPLHHEGPELGPAAP